MINNSKVLIVTDINKDNKTDYEVLNSIINRISKPDINWNSHSTYFLNDKEIEELIRRECSKERFMKLFKKVEKEFDINKLMFYAEKTNLELYQKLKRGYDLAESLWQEFKKSNENGIDFDSNYLFLQNIFERTGYLNIVELLSDHKLVDLTFNDAHKRIPYGFIGRGFFSEGCAFPILKPILGDDTGKKAIVLSSNNIKDLSLEDQICYVNEILNHEIGHAFLKLQDHCADEISPDDCIMSVANSREETIRVAKQKRGFKFCKNCDIIYKNSDLYKNNN